MNASQASREFDDFLQLFDKESFSPLLSKCSSKNGWDQDYAALVLDEYAKFLFLAGQKVPLVPSSPVDDIWHEHILTTRKYQKDCDTLVGHFVHHNPSFTDDDRKALAPKFDEMKVAYERTFGSMPGKVWTHRADRCNNRCEADCGGGYD
eukprot:CAMPEP_0118654544 /NCGR_PEP_ID=MMETSP0785-20121206/12451_1 /TAXON_ID=91992 /ORGANISM="Bolidomonas pacifica, Strain CCMP 1866" /LENGTH=149 /DNA_ID=CAMNT_0006547221 /DNA_START=26 /DNA_END=475 /DNA_ORIENTATION=-